MGHWKDLLSSLILMVILLLLSGYSTFAQSGSTTANATGKVLDQEGGAIGGAVIEFKNLGTNFEREAISEDNGSFSIAQLPPGLYQVTARAESFSAEVLRLDMKLGTTTLINFILKIGGVGEVVIVQNTEVAKTESSTSIPLTSINNLPINKRDFLDFSLTTPRAKQDPRPSLQGVAISSLLSFNGQSSRQNNITIDGLNNNDLGSGSVRSTFSQDAVQEFQVISDNYSAEFGRAIGGIVNIVTRSGSNELHGTIFSFNRNDKISTRDPFASFRPPYRQYQFGGTLSGPIKHDRAFFFTSFERLSIKQNNVVTIPDAIIASARRLGFDAQNGPVPFPVDTTSVLARADLRVNSNDFLSFRYNFGGSFNGSFEPYGGPRAPSAGGIQDLNDNSFSVNNIYANSPLGFVNETRFLYSHRDQNIISPSNGPLVTLVTGNGIIEIGRNAILPQPRTENLYQIVDNFSLTRGRNQIKFGADFTYIDVESRVPLAESGQGFFSDINFGDIVPGLPLFRAAEAFDPAVRTVAQQSFLVALSGALPTLFPGFPRGIDLTKASLPLLYIQGFGSRKEISVSLKQFSAYFEDGLKIRPNLLVKLGARYDINRVRFQPDNSGNISPRVAVSYNPDKFRRLSINAAYGLFFAPPFFGPAVLSQPTDRKFVALPFPFSIPPFLQPGHRLPPSEQVPPQVPFVPQLNQEVQFQKDLRNGYAQQGRLAFDFALNKDTVVTVSYNYLRGIKLFSPRQINLVVRPVPGDLFASLITGRSDPTRGDVAEFESAFDSYYHAMTLAINKKFSNRFGLLASYTLSKAIDDFNDNVIPAQQESQNTFDPGDERGLSLLDTRHRFVLSGIWDLNYTNNLLLRDFQVSSIVTVQSGAPYNLLAGVDLNGDSDNLSDRPPALGRNAGILPSFANVDMRLTRTIRINDRVRFQATVEAFNLFNRTNIKSGSRVFLPDAQGNFKLPKQEGGRFILPPENYLIAFSSRLLQFGLRLTF